MKNGLIARRHLMFTVNPPEGDQGGGGDTSAAKTFTQAEVDAIVLKRAERVAADKYGDYADLKAQSKRLADIEAANASDLEKAVKAAREEGATSVTEKVNGRLVQAEARALAAEAKFRNPTLAVRALDLSEVKVAEDGSVDQAAVKALLADLAEDDPYLVDDGKTGPRPDPNQGGGGGGKPSQVDEGKEQARRRFGDPANRK